MPDGEKGNADNMNLIIVARVRLNIMKVASIIGALQAHNTVIDRTIRFILFTQVITW